MENVRIEDNGHMEEAWWAWVAGVNDSMISVYCRQLNHLMPVCPLTTRYHELCKISAFESPSLWLKPCDLNRTLVHFKDFNNKE